MTNPSPYGEYPNYQQPTGPQQPYPSQPYEPYAPPPQPAQTYDPNAQQPPQQPYPGYAAPYGAPQYPNYLPGSGPTSGMAIASLVCSLLGIGLVGVILGHIALSQINASNGYTQGKGLAIAGLVIGYLQIAAVVLVILLIVIAAASAGTTTTP